MSNAQFIIGLLSKEDVVREIRKNMNALLSAVPELRDVVGFEQHHPHHHLDAWEHTLLALGYSQNRLATRLALLFHDIGKPSSCQRGGEVWHYKGHAEKSAEIAGQILSQNGFEPALGALVCELIKFHDTPLSRADILRDCDFARELYEVQRCDAMAHNPVYNDKRIAYLENIEIILKEF